MAPSKDPQWPGMACMLWASPKRAKKEAHGNAKAQGYATAEQLCTAPQSSQMTCTKQSVDT